MVRGLFLLIIGIGGLWLVLDQYYGNKHLDAFVKGLIGV